jgi:hypothetical protein
MKTTRGELKAQQLKDPLSAIHIVMNVDGQMVQCERLCV